MSKIADDKVIRYIKYPEFRTSRVSPANLGVLLGQAWFAQGFVPLPKRFWYDYCFQFVRESHQELEEDCRDWLIFCLLEDGKVGSESMPEARWNKLDIDKLLTSRDRYSPVQHQAIILGPDSLPQYSVDPETETRKKLIDFVLSHLPQEEINRAFRCFSP